MKTFAYKHPQVFYFMGIFVSLLVLFLLTNLLNPFGPFHEDSIYLFYTESIIKDLDFNIINQVPAKTSWMVTDRWYHPDHHEKFQTPVIWMLRLIELGIKKFISPLYMDYYLASFGASIFANVLGIMACKELSHIFGIKISKSSIILFFTSCSFFFFSFFLYNVIEIFCFPIMGYVLLFALRIKLRTEIKDIHYLALGLGCAVLLITKPTYMFLCIFTSVTLLLYCLEKKQLKPILVFLIGVVFLYGLTAVNRLNQFGAYAEPALYFSQNVFDHSWSDVFLSLTKGVWSGGGLFNTNPAYLFALLGIGFFFYDNKCEGKYRIWELVLLVGWIGASLLQTVPIIGYMLDDHLVGRLSLTAAPLWLLGFSYLYQRFAYSKIFKSLLCISALWHLGVVANYLLIELDGYYSYVQIKFLSTSLWEKTASLFRERMLLNIHNIQHSFFAIVSFVALLAFILHRFYFSANKTRYMTFLSLFVSLIFGAMTFVNHIYAPKNIFNHKKEQVYDNKVIVSHGPILIFDYVIGRLITVQRSDDIGAKEKLKQIVDKYYRAIKSQIIKSNPEFDKLLSERILMSPYFQDLHD